LWQLSRTADGGRRTADGGAVAFTTVLVGEDRIHLSILNWAFMVIIVMSWLVPVFVPLARFARWQVKPPTLTSHTR